MVFTRIFKADDRSRAASQLYDRVVGQARMPGFYLDLGIRDDLEGRFDLVVLHLHLVIRHLSAGDKDAHAGDVGQALFDTFFHDMDRSLRAIGVGDMSIARKVKDMVRAFYGRTGAYEAALSTGDEAALAEALARNVYAGADEAGHAGALAAYVFRAAAHVANLNIADVIRGDVSFPELKT